MKVVSVGSASSPCIPIALCTALDCFRCGGVAAAVCGLGNTEAEPASIAARRASIVIGADGVVMTVVASPRVETYSIVANVVVEMTARCARYTHNMYNM